MEVTCLQFRIAGRLAEPKLYFKPGIVIPEPIVQITILYIPIYLSVCVCYTYTHTHASALIEALLILSWFTAARFQTGLCFLQSCPLKTHPPHSCQVV